MSNEYEPDTDRENPPEGVDLLAELSKLADMLGGALIEVESAETNWDDDGPATLAAALSAALFAERERPAGLPEGREMALIVRPDMTRERVIYGDLGELVDTWATHLGADTDRVGAGVVALPMEGDIVLWARTWEPGEYDLDTLEANVVAGFLFWMANDRHHLPIFGPVMLTGAPHDHGVRGLGALDLRLMENVVDGEHRAATDDPDQQARMVEQFRIHARDGQMVQDMQEIREHRAVASADPRLN